MEFKFLIVGQTPLTVSPRSGSQIEEAELGRQGFLPHTARVIIYKYKWPTVQYQNYSISDLSSDKFTVNLFFCLGHAIGAAGIYLSWDKNQDKEITKDEVSKFFMWFMCMRMFYVLLSFTTFQKKIVSSALTS